MLDLNDVALFVHIVRAGSIAAAARRIGMPSNTASRRIQQLEEHLGVRLMQRSTRRLTLTDAGQALFSKSADQVDALEHSARDLADGSGLPSGKVRVAAAADFFSVFSMGWIAELLDAYPKMQLEFVLSDEHADLLDEKIDVAVRAGKDLDPNLIARPIGTSWATLVASPAYMAARGSPESIDALSLHDCIASSGQAVWRLDGPGGPHEVRPSGRFYANTARVMLEAVLSGLGIALLPAAITTAHVRSGELVEVLPGYRVEGMSVAFVYLSRRQLPRAVRAFIDFASAKMVEEGLVGPAATTR